MSKNSIAAVCIAATLLLLSNIVCAQRATLEQLHREAQQNYSVFDRDELLCAEVDAEYYVQAVKYIYAYQQVWLWTADDEPPAQLDEAVREIERRALACLQSYEAEFSSAGFSGGGGGGLIAFHSKPPPLPAVPSQSRSMGQSAASNRMPSPPGQFGTADANEQPYRRLVDEQDVAWPAGIWILQATDGGSGDDMFRMALIPEGQGRFRALVFGDQPGEMMDFGVSDRLIFNANGGQLKFANRNSDGGLRGIVSSDGEVTPVQGYRYGDQRLGARRTF